MYHSSATSNGRKTAPTGTVAILLALLNNKAAVPFARAHAAKVLAVLRAVVALPALRRLAVLSSEAEVRVAAREAIDRITKECQAPAGAPTSPGILVWPGDRAA